jgi:C1A family cysteine protease/fibronectin type 3 domain-containing protein
MRKIGTGLSVLLLILITGPNGSQDPGYVPAEGALLDSVEDIERVPLADSATISHRGLPSSVDLAPYFPVPGQQGNQGSCVGWSSTYALKSYHEKRKKNWNYGPHVQTQNGRGEHVFSPAWTYNQINHGRDRGAHIPHALDLLIEKGAVPWQSMPYSTSDYRRQPTGAQKQLALQYRAKRYESVPPNNIAALKAELAKGYPLVIGVYSGPDRWRCCKNNVVLDGFTQANRNQHAMVLVGYDDGRRSPKGHRGAFKIMDSDGDRWGTAGFGWISYEFMPVFMYAAYVLRDWEGGDSVDPAAVQTDKGLKQPQQVRASQGSFADRVVISWQKVDNALSYEVERSTAGDRDFTSVGFAEELRFADTGAAANTAYDYRVVAIGDGEKSDASAAMVVRGFTTQNTKPGQVTGLSGELVAGGRVSLSWEALPNADRYDVSRKQHSTGAWKLITSVRGTSHTDYYPEAGDNAYTVSAVRGGDRGPESEAVTVGAKAGSLSTVENLVASQGTHKDRIQLTWDAIPNATKYWIVRLNKAKSGWDEVAWATSNTYEDKSAAILDGESTAYSVRAVNATESGGAARAAWGNTNPNLARAGEVPTPPRGLTATLSRTQVQLSWTAVSGAAEYYVMRKKHTEKDFQLLATTRSTRHSDTLGGSESTLWFYTVRAKSRQGGESANSNVAAASYNIARSAPAARGSDPVLGSLAGTWQANIHAMNEADSKAAITLNGNTVIINLSVAGRAKQFVGYYVVGTGRLEASGISLQKPDADSQNILLTCRDKSICRTPFRQAFVKIQ